MEHPGKDQLATASKETPLAEKISSTRPTAIRNQAKPGMLTISQYQDRLWRRFYRTLDYVSIALSILAI